MKQMAGVLAGLALFAIGASSRDPLWVLAFAPVGMVVMVFYLRSISDDRKATARSDSRGSATAKRRFALVALLAALLFLLIQLRVIDLTAVFARFALQESTGEGLIFIGLLMVVALFARRLQ